MEKFKLPRINANIIYPGMRYVGLLSAVLEAAGYHDQAILIKNGVNALNENVKQTMYNDAYMEAIEIAHEFWEEGIAMVMGYEPDEEFKLPGHLLIQQSQWKKTHNDIINQRLSHYYKTGM